MNIDEAKKIIHDDLLIRRMIYFRINMKANRLITPKVVREAYEEYAKNNIQPAQYRYRMVTVRGKEATDNAAIAEYLHQLLTEENAALDDLKQQMDSHGYHRPDVTFTVSQEFEQSEKEIPEANLKVLTDLEPGSFSKPVAQRSRANNAMVFRIFALMDFTPGGVTPYAEAAPKIEDQLLDQKMAQERDKYFERLRKRYNVPENQLDEMIPEDFQPFSQH